MSETEAAVLLVIDCACACLQGVYYVRNYTFDDPTMLRVFQTSDVRVRVTVYKEDMTQIMSLEINVSLRRRGKEGRHRV